MKDYTKYGIHEKRLQIQGDKVKTPVIHPVMDCHG